MLITLTNVPVSLPLRKMGSWERQQLYRQYHESGLATKEVRAEVKRSFRIVKSVVEDACLAVSLELSQHPKSAVIVGWLVEHPSVRIFLNIYGEIEHVKELQRLFPRSGIRSKLKEEMT